MFARMRMVVIMRIAVPTSALMRFSVFLHLGAFLQLKSYLSSRFMSVRRAFAGIEFV